MQKAVIILVYSAKIRVIGCVQNFDVYYRKIKENLSQNPICNFERILLIEYLCEKSEIIVCDYSIKVFSKL